MRVVAAVRGGTPTDLMDACAARITDPVLRLKYLRQNAALPPEPPRREDRPPGARRRWPGAVIVVLAFLVPACVSEPVVTPPALRPVERPAPVPAAQPVRVWLVERTQEHEIYSNGLRIENDFTVAGKPRLFRALPRQGGAPRWRTDPAGIVFHSSESDTAEFEPEQTGLLKQQGRNLLEYVRRHQCYHFLIDRFGTVHRIVDEGAKAGHAGHSIWADADWVYINLNASFLGVCFEAQLGAGGVSSAQVHSSKVLVEMLRSRYGIAATNCVSHAQVSVNPGNFRIGYHTDWASGLPYQDLGLPDNYSQPLPSLLLFGFQADSLFVNRAGSGLRQALSATEEQVRRAAAASHMDTERYSKGLKQSYAAAVETAGSPAVM